MKADNFTVMYKPGYEWEAQQVLNNLEHHRSYVVDLTGNEMGCIPVVVEDAGLMSNGFTNPALHTIHIYTNPGGMVTSLEGLEDWYRLVSIHEYTHMGHITKTRGLPKICTHLFGFPFQMNEYAPGWMFEGITVYSESQPSPYEGRLNDGFFDAYIGAKVYSKSFPSIIEATNAPVSFPRGIYYLYGGQFFQFLATRYGEESFAEFFNTYGGSVLAPFSVFFPWISLDRAAKKVYGKSFPALYAQWRNYEEARFSTWQPEGERITHKGWYIPSFIRNGHKLYYTRTLPIKLDAFTSQTSICIIELDVCTKEEKVIAALNAPITSSMKIHDDFLYYTTYELKKAPNVTQHGFGLTSSMHKRNLTTDKETILFNDDIRSFCVLADGSLLYTKDQTHEFGSEIWRYENNERKMVKEIPYLINEMAADSHTIVVVARANQENWNIYRLSDHLEPILTTPWIEGSIHLMGDTILFTANYDKHYSNYLVDLNKNKLYRLTQNGFAHNGAIIDDTLYFIGLSQDGFDIYKIGFACEEVVLGDWPLTPKSTLQNTPFTRGGYGDICKTLFPKARVPFFYPADTTLTKWVYGMILYGGDATHEHIYEALVAYDQLEASPIIKASMNSLFFVPLGCNATFDYNDSIDVTVSYPVLKRLNPGFSQISFFSRLNAFEKYARKEITPGIGVGIKYPSTRLSLTFSLPIERKAWKSEIDRTAQLLHVQLQQIVLGGELRFKNFLFNDPQEPDTHSITIRGDTSITVSRGALCVVEYSHHLLNLRWGMWNPNIYFEDLFGTVFIDYCLSHTGENINSVGLELKLETKVVFGFFQLIPTVGIALIKGKEFKPYFKLLGSFDY